MILRRGSDHFHAADFTVLNQERLGHQDTRWPVEALELVRLAIGEDAFIDRPLVKHRMRPDYAALAVNHRITAMVDALHHEVIAELELPHAVHGERVDAVGGRRITRWSFRRIGPVFNAGTVVREVVGSRSVDPFAVVMLKAAEIAVGDSDQSISH